MTETELNQGGGAPAAKPLAEAEANKPSRAMTDAEKLALVPGHIIPAELPHPTTSGGMLARGVRYLHHFELELVSDGRRMWAAASAQGRAVLAAIEGEKQAHDDAIDAHRAGGAGKPGEA